MPSKLKSPNWKPEDKFTPDQSNYIADFLISFRDRIHVLSKRSLKISKRDTSAICITLRNDIDKVLNDVRKELSNHK